MKNKLTKLLCFVFAISCCVLCFACNNAAIATINGFEINSIEVFHVTDNYYNLSVGVTNTNDTAKQFDFSGFLLKLNDQTELQHEGDTQDYSPNQYFKWSFQIDNSQNILAVGDSVTVYYNLQKLKTITIDEF